MGAIGGIDGNGGRGVSVLRVRSSTNSLSKPVAEQSSRLVSRFQGKAVDGLMSNLDLAKVDDQAPHESLFRYGQSASSLTGASTLDLQAVLNPFANLPATKTTPHFSSLTAAQFDLPTGLERYDAAQVADLMDPDYSETELQRQLNISADELRETQEGLRQLGFDLNGHKQIPMNMQFFSAGKPLKPEQYKPDEFNQLLESSSFYMNPDEMAELDEALSARQPSLTDRNWGHLFSGNERMYRFYADTLGLSRSHPTLVAPYGITPARQKNGDIIYRAPLLGNQNQLGQLSMERMTALGVLAAWRWFSNWTKERFGEQAIEMYGMEIEVIPIAEVHSDFSAIAQQPSLQRIEEMLRHMRNFGKDTLKMDTMIYDSRGVLVAVVRTKFGVFSSSKSKRRSLHAASLT